MFDQDFINDGYADGKFLRVKMKCPECSRIISKRWSAPMPEVRCHALVPRKTPRKKGEPRKVPCDAVMQEIENESS
jgi:hypothetical protein